MSDIFRDYSFGGLLREFRHKRSITLRAAAAKLGINAGNFSKLECSRLSPPTKVSKVKELAKHLKLDESETEMLLIAAFNYHLGMLKKRWER